MYFLVIILIFHSSFDAVAGIKEITFHAGPCTRTNAETKCSRLNMRLPGYLKTEDRKYLRRQMENSSIKHTWLAVKRFPFDHWQPVISTGVNCADNSCVLGEDEQLQLTKDPSKRCLKIHSGRIKAASCHVKVKGFLCFVRGALCKACHYWNCLLWGAGSCLKVGLHDLTWSQAETECQAKGGHLWIKTNSISDENIVKQLKEHADFKDPEYWIGWRAEEWRFTNKTAGMGPVSDVFIRPGESGQGDCATTIFDGPDDLRWKRVACDSKHSFVCIKMDASKEVTRKDVSGKKDAPTGTITDKNWFKYSVLGGSVVVGFIFGCVIGRCSSGYKRKKHSSARIETSSPKDPDQEDEKVGEEEETYAEIDEVRRRSIRMSLRHPKAAMHEDRKSDADSSSTPAINVNKYQISQPVDSTKDSSDGDSNYESADMINANVQQETFPSSPAAKGVMIVNPRTPLAYLESDVDY